MKCYSYVVFFCLLCLSWSCSRNFDDSSKGMRQLNQMLEHKFGAGAWYSSITLVQDGVGDNIISVEHSADPDKTRQEQWTWFHGFWEKKADIQLQFSGIAPRDLLFQLQNGDYLLKLGSLIENMQQELRADAAKGNCKLVMAGIKMNDPVPPKFHNLAYIVQLKTDAGVVYSYTYDEQGLKLPDELKATAGTVPADRQ